MRFYPRQNRTATLLTLPFWDVKLFLMQKAPTVKLTDLRTPTPWTFVDSYTLASCGAKPTTAIVYVTIYISGTAYPAATEEKYVMGAATAGAVTWVFPDLIVTNLSPGQVATVVRPS